MSRSEALESHSADTCDGVARDLGINKQNPKYDRKSIAISASNLSSKLFHSLEEYHLEGLEYSHGCSSHAPYPPLMKSKKIEDSIYSE